MSNKKMNNLATLIASNRHVKNGEKLPVAFLNAVKSVRIPAYGVAAKRHDAVGVASPEPINQAALYEAVTAMLDMVGEVNGMMLDKADTAEAVILHAARIRVIDITEEMAHAHAERSAARKAERENDDKAKSAELELTVKEWDAKCKELEETPGNCKRLFDIASESAFVKAVCVVIGDAINGQAAKSAEEIEAEIKAKKEERKARAKAKKAAKKEAEKAAALAMAEAK